MYDFLRQARMLSSLGLLTSTAHILVTLIVAVGAADKYPDRIVATEGQSLQWTAKWPTDTRFEILNSKPLSFNLSCNILPTSFFESDQGKPQREIEFCIRQFRPYENANKCQKLNARYPSHTLQIEGVPIQLKFSAATGLTASVDKLPPDSVLPLSRAYCKEFMSGGRNMFSNQVFIVDLRKNFPRDLWKPTAAPQLRRNAASSVQCLQKSLGIDALLQSVNKKYSQPAVRIDFDWFYCSGSSLGACEASKKSLRELLPFSDWPVQVRADGELYMPSVPAKVASQLKDKRLLCTLMGKPAAFYTAPVSIVDTTAAAASALAMVRPQSGSVEAVVLYNSAAFSLVLPCLFNSTPGASVDVAWSFEAAGKEKVPLKMGAENDKLKVSVAPRGITFRGRFSPATEGLYHCSVTSSGRTVTGTYNVTYKGPIRAAPSMKHAEVLIRKSNRAVRCLFEDQGRVITGLKVAGEEVDFKSVDSVNATRATINKNLNGVMPPINFTVNRIRPDNGEVVEITEWDAKYDKALQSQHIVTCKGKDKLRTYLFQQSWNIVFITVPNPIIEMEAPKKCSGSCDLKAELVNRKDIERKGVKADVCWFLNSTVGAAPLHCGSEWNYRPQHEGLVTVCAAARLGQAGSHTFATCTTRSIAAQPGSPLLVRVLVPVIVLLVVALALAAGVIFYVKKKRAGRQEGRESSEMRAQNKKLMDA